MTDYNKIDKYQHNYCKNRNMTYLNSYGDGKFLHVTCLYNSQSTVNYIFSQDYIKNDWCTSE